MRRPLSMPSTRVATSNPAELESQIPVFVSEAAADDVPTSRSPLDSIAEAEQAVPLIHRRGDLDPADVKRLRVADVLTLGVVSATPAATIEDVMSLVQRYEHVPVVDETGRPVGVVTQKDILEVSSSSLSTKRSERDALILSRVTVDDVMRRTMITCGREDVLFDVARKMWRAQKGCVLVVNADEHLLGMITAADFVRLFAEV